MGISHNRGASLGNRVQGLKGQDGRRRDEDGQKNDLLLADYLEREATQDRVVCFD